MMATPCLASARARRVCGERVSSRMLGLSPARRQAASKARRRPYPPSSSSNGKGARPRDLDRAMAAKCHRWVARGEELGRFQLLAPELPIVQWNPVWKHLTKMYLATLQHCQNLKATSLRDLYLHVGIALRVAVQEL